MQTLLLIAATSGLLIGAIALGLLLQQRKAYNQVASALAHSRRIEIPGRLSLVGRRTQPPNYIPPTDEVVWRHRLRRLSLEAIILDERARPELELSL